MPTVTSGKKKSITFIKNILKSKIDYFGVMKPSILAD